jgi:vacuolar protein sorting-associated protein 3
VNESRKIPLFPISSLDETHTGSIGGKIEEITGTTSHHERGTKSFDASQGFLGGDGTHSRTTSLGGLVGNLGRRTASPQPSGLETPDRRDQSPSPALSPGLTPGGTSNRRAVSPDKPLPATPSERDVGPSISFEHKESTLLRPHILSPNPNEFMLTTGTTVNEGGVGIFVNLDGDVSRGTLQFERYPEEIVVDGRGAGNEPTGAVNEEEEEGFVLAVMQRGEGLEERRGLTILRWDVEGASETMSDWVDIYPASCHVGDESLKPFTGHVGIRKIITAGETSLTEVGDKLRLVRMRLSPENSGQGSPDSVDSADSRTQASLERVSKEMELFESQASSGEDGPERGWESKKVKEEDQIARRLGVSQSRIMVWAEDQIWWAVRNPLVIRLDARLGAAEAFTSNEMSVGLDHGKVIEVLNSIRGQVGQSELEFVSLGYIRQKAGLLLFTSLLRPSASKSMFEKEKKLTEEALLEGSVDPRVVLSTIPGLREEVIEGKTGIWIYGGIKEIAEKAYDSQVSLKRSVDNLDDEFLHLMKRYLTSWRGKKGFGSIQDEREVFRTVDAALLKVLLLLDKRIASAAPTQHSQEIRSSLRREIYAVVDGGVACFERAIALLESYRRLYVLSRLYQSEGSSKDVLKTWKRILDGEQEDGGDYSIEELEVMIRKYLGRRKDAALVEEYGGWLAERNPRLGIQVFADETSKVKFEVPQVVDILKKRAPDAVKEYLEYLVFTKQVSSIEIMYRSRANVHRILNMQMT